MNERIFKEKIAALLHDPPDKAWFVAGKKILGETHEEETKIITEKIFRGTSLLDVKNYLNSNKIKGADRLSASVDRYLLEILIGEKYGAFHVPYIKIKNPFNPEVMKEISSDLDVTKVEEFCKALNKILSLINRAKNSNLATKMAYFLLYSFYELVWINKGLPVSPSDTRVPISTVFDHNYATASLLNFIDEEGNLSGGLIVVIDIPGVQNYISASRKLRDLWASSYLVSALVWSIIKDFINIFGPDILVIPTARFNTFFYHHVFSLISQELNLNESELNELARYLKIKDIEGREISIYDPRSGFPRFAVMPATVTLFLPSLKSINENYEFKKLTNEYIKSEVKNVEDIKKLISEIFRKRWNSIYENLSKIYGDVDVDAFISSIMENILEKIKIDYNFNSVPPFNPRIIVLKLEGIKGEIEKEIEEIRKSEKYKSIKDEDINYIIYHKIFKKINEELGKLKSLKIESFAELNITKFTEDVYNENVPGEFEYLKIVSKGKGFYYCTVCGHLPSVLNLPRDDKEFECFIKNKLKVKIDNVDGLKIYFSPGEKLCPYCLIKRLFSIEPKRVLKELLGSIVVEHPEKIRKDLSDNFDLEIPSLADISTYNFKREVISKIVENRSDYNKLVELINKIRVKPDIVTKEPLWIAYKRILEEAKGLGLNEYDFEALKMRFILKESEELFLESDERRREWVELKKKFGIKGSIGIYYALIRCDGDNIGKLISGRIKDILYDFKKYLETSYENASKHIIENIYNENKVKELLKENSIAEGNFNSFKHLFEFLYYEYLKGDILVTMAYHTALSRALMVNALYDVSIVENDYNGFVIYAGGDDLLALCPVGDSLRITDKTRKIFKNGTSSGFNCLGNNYYIPTLAITGRSYSVYYAHYKYPMYFTIYNSYKRLEELAKGSKWYLDKNLLSEKDTLCLVYSPRGGEILSLIPLEIKCSNDYIDVIIKLIELIEDGVISRSLIYKLIDKDNLERWKKLVEVNSELFIKDVIYTLTKDVRFEDKPKLDFIKKWVERNYGIKNNIEQYLFENMFKSLRIVTSGFRGE